MNKNIYLLTNITKSYLKNLRRKLSFITINNKKLIIFVFAFLVLFLFLYFYETRFDYSIELKHACNCKKDLVILKKYYDKFYVKFKEEKYEFNDNFNATCDLYNVLKRGKSQKVLGYSLYGRNEFYYQKLIDIITEVEKLYPKWSIRIYYDNSINKSIICDIECKKNEYGFIYNNVDFCNIEKLTDKFINASYVHSMKWRWFPLGDSFVDIFSSRDIDSFILPREIDAVDEWINSKKVGHIMRGKI
jgi:hypothetical protein